MQRRTSWDGTWIARPGGSQWRSSTNICKQQTSKPARPPPPTTNHRYLPTPYRRCTRAEPARRGHQRNKSASTHTMAATTLKHQYQVEQSTPHTRDGWMVPTKERTAPRYSEHVFEQRMHATHGCCLTRNAPSIAEEQWVSRHLEQRHARVGVCWLVASPVDGHIVISVHRRVDGANDDRCNKRNHSK